MHVSVYIYIYIYIYIQILAKDEIEVLRRQICQRNLCDFMQIINDIIKQKMCTGIYVLI